MLISVEHVGGPDGGTRYGRTDARAEKTDEAAEVVAKSVSCPARNGGVNLRLTSMRLTHGCTVYGVARGDILV
jgi:hypothetical protein